MAKRKKRKRRRKYKPRQPSRKRLSTYAIRSLKEIGYPRTYVPPSDMPDVIILRADVPRYRCLWAATNLGSWFIVHYALTMEMFTKTCDWGPEDKHPMATMGQTARFKAAAQQAGLMVDDRTS